MTPALRTARLALDPLDPSDAPEMALVLGDPRLYKFMGGEPLDEPALLARYERLAVGHSSDGRESWHNWTCRLLTTGEAIGTVQATVSTEGPRAEIAWVIGVPWQGRGYATEAASALVEWLASSGSTTIEANVAPGHIASESVAARLGMTVTDRVVDGERVWRRSNA